MKKDSIKLLVIGRRLRNIRKSISLSRQEIERKHSISANSLKAWEMGSVEIGVLRLVSYLKIFEQYNVKIPIETLLQTAENYLDTVHQQSAARTLGNNFISQAVSHSGMISEDIELICNLFRKEITSIIREKDLLFRSLIDNMPFKICLKDENNFILVANNFLVHRMGCTRGDFEGKNCYDLFPTMAKKCHEDDLKTITSNTSLTNIVGPYQLTTNQKDCVSINKIPIVCPEINKSMILVIGRAIDGLQ